MKLAEALRLKVDLDLQLRKMQERITSETVVEEEDKSTSGVYSLLHSYDTLSKRLLQLNVAINRANMENTVTYASYFDNIQNFSAIGDSGTNALPDKVVTSTKPVMEALAERERLTSDIRAYTSFLRTSEVGPRYSVDDVKKKSNLESAKLRKRVDAMSKYLRLTDNKIQENNWLIEFSFE